MPKITERVLKGICSAANSNTGSLRFMPFGLKVERVGGGYMLWRIYREPGREPDLLMDAPATAMEAHFFLMGFLSAVRACGGCGAD